MYCGAYKDRLCAVRNSTDTACQGEMSKCVCPDELERVSREKADDYADNRAKRRHCGE